MQALIPDVVGNVVSAEEITQYESVRKKYLRMREARTRYVQGGREREAQSIYLYS